MSDDSGTPFEYVRPVNEDSKRLWHLTTVRPLKSWKPLPVKLVKGKRADMLWFAGACTLAVRPEIHGLLQPILRDAAEFLPLRAQRGERFLALRPLHLVKLSRHAEVSINQYAGCISSIRRLAFARGALKGIDCFRVWHPDQPRRPDSLDGYREIYVSGRVRAELDKLKLRGIWLIRELPTTEPKDQGLPHWP